MITVISQTTKEREEETRQLFLQLKPLLDQGYTLGKAVKQELNIKHGAFYNQAWYKDLKKECIKQGVKPKWKLLTRNTW